MIRLLFVTSLLLPRHLAPPDAWIAEDKLRHFVASFVVTSLSASGARVAGLDRPTSIGIGIGVAAAAGIAKEVHDAHTTGLFSVRDLTWDATGIAAAAVVLDAAR